MATKKSSKKNADRTVYDDGARIKVIGDYEPRKGKKTVKMFNMLKASKTVGDFKARRHRAGVTGTGKMFAKLVEQKIVRVSA